MEDESNNEFQIVFPEATQSDSNIMCHLSSGISAVNMEIRWFKETDCVCFYKNRRLIEGESYEGIMSLCIDELERGIVSLQLKDVGESYVGNYLCQITSGDRTKEITLNKSLKSHEDQTEMLQQTTTLRIKQINKAWTDKERIKMANSALLAVFCNLEKTDAPKEDLQGINAKVLRTDIEFEENQNETEEKDTQQQNASRHINESTRLPVVRMETSTCKLEEQETKPKISNLANQLGCSSQKLLDSDVKVCIFQTGKTNASDKQFTDILKRRIENLKEVSTVDKTDIILVFCPIVSRTGTYIDKALEIFNGKTETKLAVLVVLHLSFDPEKIILDSSKYVSRTDILTVDCLFNEDSGLLVCQKNSEAFEKVVNWLILQGRETGVKICLRQNFTNPEQIQYQEWEILDNLNKNEGQSHQVKIKRQKIGNNKSSTKEVKVFSILAGKTYNCHEEFIVILRNRIENLREGRTVDESDFILVFCPVVSRTGTDIEAALKTYSHYTDSKLTVLVVLHHSFDPEKMVPDSSRCVNRTNIVTVDCLFNEDVGLLMCRNNSDSTDKAVNWLIQQGAKIGITISPCQYKSSETDKSSGFSYLLSSCTQAMEFLKKKSGVQVMTHSSSRPVKYIIHVTGNTWKCDVDFIDAVQKLVHLRKVSSVQDSDITLLFCPVFLQSDINTAFQECDKTQDKPVVVIFLHNTLDSNFVPNSSGSLKRQDVLVVDCMFCDGEGLPDCKKNREAISAVADWIKNKFRDH